MIPINLSPFANHIWQSTLFACAAAILTLALRKNRAQIRYWLWLAASIKFLIPWTLLVSVGSRIDWRTAAVAAPPVAPAIRQIAQPFALLPAPVFAAPSTAVMPPIGPGLLLAAWLAGGAFLLSRWWVRWWRIRMALRTASPLGIVAPIPVMSSPMRLEPGVFGVFRPVLLLPDGIADRLTPDQFRAVLAHELCHLRRRDNLAAALHMLVETLFWFHPLIWWVGARMVEERERACDEEVVRLGNDPEAYAAGILNVCRFYLSSPLPCAAGVTGSDLKKRIEAIMSNHILTGMTLARKSLLILAGIAAVAGPIAIGIVSAPRVVAQTQAALKFEVASIKPSDPDSRGMRLERIAGNGLRTTGTSLSTLIQFAYDIGDFQLSSAPSWIRNARYDILARPEKPEGPDDIDHAPEALKKSLYDQLRERTRSLLAERFGLVAHRETGERSVLVLAVAKNGHKLQAPKEDTGISRDLGVIRSEGATMEMLAHVLGMVLRNPVLNKTGLEGKYKFKLEWTEEPGAAKEKGIATAPDANPPEAGQSIYSAIQQQLGLKLEAQKAPVDVIVIDRVEKPSEN
jgi:bla regulator protein blaR1